MPLSYLFKQLQSFLRTDNVVPHVIVGDEAFALHEKLTKPYPRKQTLSDPL
jgi:hypothetical protein